MAVMYSNSKPIKPPKHRCNKAPCYSSHALKEGSGNSSGNQKVNIHNYYSIIIVELHALAIVLSANQSLTC